MTYSITTDKTRFDVDTIHTFLSRHAYWSPGVPRDYVERAIANSLCFAVLDGEKQVGFARVITDYVSMAYIADVFILPSHRRRGLAQLLMRAIREHADLQRIRRWHLVTRDAHELYRKFGFEVLKAPERHMEVVFPAPWNG
jgi:GNAT superfamily N-acetyltransferase